VKKMLGGHGLVRVRVHGGSVRRMLLAAAPVPLALVLLVALFGFGPWSSLPTAHASGTSTDVLLVHGFDFHDVGLKGDGGDVGAPQTFLHQWGWSGRAFTVGFYTKDASTCNIRLNTIDETRCYTYPGGKNYSPSGGDRSTIGTRDEDIRHIACVLSWYIWDHYTKFGRPVDLVGHSMGGIIIRWALYATPRSGSAFPPNLYVPAVVTFASPHHGIYTGASVALCPFNGCLQVSQLELHTSQTIMQELMTTGRNPQGTGGTGSTVWTIMGSSGDTLLGEYAVDGMDALHKVWYINPTYGHGEILWQDSRNQPPTNGDGATVDYCDTACAVAATGSANVFVGGSHNSGTYSRPMIRMEQALFDADPGASQPHLLTNPGFNFGNFNYWQRWPNTNWAIYHANQVGNKPYEGSYFAATNTWQSGGSFYQDVSRTINTGDIYCASAQVGTQGASGGASGTIALFFLYNTDEGAGQTFSNLPGGGGDGTVWTPTQVCLKATRPHSSLRVQFYPTPNGPTVIVDDVRVFRVS
jgi:hypothetical protein